MTVTTSRNKTFRIEWMWGPVDYDGSLMLQMEDDRLLSEIAIDFEGIEHFHRESEEEGDIDYDGYTVLKAILRPEYERNKDIVQLTLARPDNY